MSMRFSWVTCLAGAASILVTTSAYAAGSRHLHQLTQPDHADLIFARTGIARPAHAGGRTVATFDYDQDGDLDLFVGSQQGSVIWLNQGFGVFSVLPLKWAKPVSHPPPQTWVAAEIASLTPLDRTDPVVARARMCVPFHGAVRGLAAPALIEPFTSELSSASSPRAPPQR